MRQAFAAEAGTRSEEPLVLYGDSSPFPYGIDFLDAIRATVEACVAMLAAQATIDHTHKRSAQVEQNFKLEKRRLQQLLAAVHVATGDFVDGSGRLRTVANEVAGSATAATDRTFAELDRLWASELGTASSVVGDASAMAQRALEQLLLQHIPPQTGVSWHLTAGANEDSYDATARLETRFGLVAHLLLALPAAHGWGRVRRVVDVAPATTVLLPRPLARRQREGLLAVSLDRHCVSDVEISPARILLVLRQKPRSGSGWRFAVASEDGRTFSQPLDDAGRPCGDENDLGDEREPILRLASAILDSTFDLVLRRERLTAATLDGQPLDKRHEPREVCARLIDSYAPVVAEIARRSHPTTELTLRKNLGGGRREAMFIRRAELLERIARVPPPLRALFDPLGL
ncbi:MAG TPA: hypothetical protein VIA18_33065 [Polyangia bacterium]|nr:hypothetical protein [Polyangia bacterium]HWE29567.1 hypothetical protein [Polyangia bacterium]